MEKATRLLLEELGEAMAKGRWKKSEALLRKLGYGVNARGEIVDDQGYGTGALYAGKLQDGQLCRETVITELDRIILGPELE